MESLELDRQLTAVRQQIAALWAHRSRVRRWQLAANLGRTAIMITRFRYVHASQKTPIRDLCKMAQLNRYDLRRPEADVANFPMTRRRLLVLSGRWVSEHADDRQLKTET
jgi:hypothetical protein